jgi:hypothetical protein
MENINSSEATDQEIKKYLDEAPQGFTVSEEVSTERTSICNACPEKVSTLGIDRCQVCNCLIKLKTKLTHTKCPIDKW